MSQKFSGVTGDQLPILALDFDGVIHDYKHGWREGKLYGHVTPGFFAWAAEAARYFTLVIHTSRAKDEEGVKKIMSWLAYEAEAAGDINAAALFDIQAEKPPALITIDDRCIRFEGDWSDPALDPSALRAFKPWMMKENPA